MRSLLSIRPRCWIVLRLDVEEGMVWSLTDLTLVARFTLLFKVSATKTIHADAVAPQDGDLLFMG